MARSYFSYSVIRSDSSTSLTQFTGGNSILTALAGVDWEVKKVNPSTNLPENTPIYEGSTGNTAISGSNGTTGTNGLIEFWANPGLYVIEITDPQARISNKNIYWDSVSGQTGGIPGENIESESITTTQIENGQVSTEDIETGAITSSLIAPSGVQTTNLGASVVRTANIDNLAVTGAKLGPGAVTSSKIDTGAVEAIHIAPGAISVESIPVGVIFPYAASGTTAPNGWLFCDGSSRTVSSLPALHAVIGYTYGGGGASFNLPDLRGRVPAGRDNMSNTVGSAPSASRLASHITSSTLGSSGGSESHQLTAAQMPSHNHGGLTGYQFVTTRVGGSLQANDNYDRPANMAGGSDRNPGVTQHAHTITSAGSDASHPNVQPTIILNYIIKVS